jgi:hypothetical protein
LTIPKERSEFPVKKKEVKKLLKQNPEFAQWLMQDKARMTEVKENPAAAAQLFKTWNDRQKGRLNFHVISQKTKRASEMLSNVQSIMDMIADYSNKENANT